MIRPSRRALEAWGGFINLAHLSKIARRFTPQVAFVLCVLRSLSVFLLLYNSNLSRRLVARVQYLAHVFFSFSVCFRHFATVFVILPLGVSQPIPGRRRRARSDPQTRVFCGNPKIAEE